MTTEDAVKPMTSAEVDEWIEGMDSAYDALRKAVREYRRYVIDSTARYRIDQILKEVRNADFTAEVRVSVDGKPLSNEEIAKRWYQ